MNVSFFPNPASDIIHINLPFEDKGVLSIFDLTGREIVHEYFEKKNNITFNISTFAKGIYLLKLKTSKGNFIKKFIKE